MSIKTDHHVKNVKIINFCLLEITSNLFESGNIHFRVTPSCRNDLMLEFNLINSFLLNVSFLIPLKTEKLWFSNVLKGN